MFDRFTDRSKKILALARTEAISNKSEAVFTEHILVGMMREGSGVAGNCLANFDLSIKQVRDEIAKLNKPREPISDRIDYSPHARDLFLGAVDEAKKIGHNYVGTEHLLLSLLANKFFNGYIILEECGIKPDKVRHYLLNLLGLAPKKYKLKDAKDVVSILDLTNGKEVVAFYHKESHSLSFVEFSNIPVDDLEEITEVCREWKESNS
jgi:ATP-dependent Clp protease ATP-binding subunit ClpC